MRKKVSKGFTLVEVLISLSILSILLMIFFSVIDISIRNNKKNEVDINALHLAQSEVENIVFQIKGNNISNIKDLKNNDIIIGNSNNYLLNNYNVAILIEQKSDLLYQINVAVKHQNDNFSKKNIQIITQVVIDKRNHT